MYSVYISGVEKSDNRPLLAEASGTNTSVIASQPTTNHSRTTI